MSHPSMERLWRYVEQATRNLPDGERVASLADLRTALDATAPQFSNWRARGISAPAALRAQALWGVSASWLLDGGDPPEPGASIEGKSVVRMLPGAPRAPLCEWGDLMQAQDLPGLFRVALRDAALAPDLVAGDELEFATQLAPQAGDLALLRASDGTLLVRVLRERLPGRWDAVALNDAYAPMAVDDALRVVAVAVAETRRRRRSAG